MTLEEKKKEIAVLLKLRGFILVDIFPIEEKCRYGCECEFGDLTFLMFNPSRLDRRTAVVGICPEHLHYYLDAKWEEV